MTPAELIDECAAQLTQAGVSFGQGTLYAEDEAAWLVLWSLGLSLDTDISLLVDPVTEQQLAVVSDLLNKRKHTRQPLAYLTGEAWLQGVSFHVDHRCLIPRSLIAETIANGSFDPWLSPDSARALDLCTGGGSLAVLLALAYPPLHIDATDISSQALEVAHINIERHGLQDRIHAFVSDGFQQIQGLYDLIVCNPPYVNAQSMNELPAEFKAEPELALAAGTDGMDFIRHLFKDVAKHMADHGILILEIGYEIHHFQRAFPHFEPMYLSTSAGDEHVLLITKQALHT
ncbi:MAG: 50S ribosomal protein L3 N(5)-glutamine methyltransferase [Limnohabitans sp.]